MKIYIEVMKWLYTRFLSLKQSFGRSKSTPQLPMLPSTGFKPTIPTLQYGKSDDLAATTASSNSRQTSTMTPPLQLPAMSVEDPLTPKASVRLSSLKWVEEPSYHGPAICSVADVSRLLWTRYPEVAEFTFKLVLCRYPRTMSMRLTIQDKTRQIGRWNKSETALVLADKMKQARDLVMLTCGGLTFTGDTGSAVELLVKHLDYRGYYDERDRDEFYEEEW